MAHESNDDLCRIKGIGAVLAQRLKETGIQTYAALAEAPDETLAAISGLNPRQIPEIRRQALDFSTEQNSVTAAPSALLPGTGPLRTALAQLHQAFDQQPPAKLKEKKRLKVLKEISRMDQALTALEKTLAEHLEDLARSLEKADRKLQRISAAPPAKLQRGLKKVRKKLASGN